MSDCIISPYARFGGGYAAKRYKGRTRGHHVWVWVWAHGEPGPGMVVMHSCDNRACINLEHLSVGTPRDNAHDMMRKGRHPWQIDPVAYSERQKNTHATRKKS